MQFSEKYLIHRSPSDDWYDTFLPFDTKLYVDPFLIWDEKAGFWASAHDHLIDFFTMIFGLIQESSGNTRDVHWKQAATLLRFPEPAEFCLGVAEGSPLGSGSGKGLQQEMLEGIRIAVGLGMNRIAHMETISLFQGGMGVDRISDCVCNVLKSYFIRYTKTICTQHAVTTQPISVRNASWSDEYCKWVDETHDLPVNEIEYTRNGAARTRTIPTLLAPERFLREIPIADPDDFWTWSWSNMGDDLRGNFNFDLARNVGRRLKARFARQNPEAVALYLRQLEDEEKKPYPIDDDPHRLVRWYADGSEIAASITPNTAPEDPENFGGFIGSIIDAYRHNIEDQDAWQLLWSNGRGRSERLTQALFRSVVIHYCRANDIDLTGESNAGRGPVDFKFSRGWLARALVEVKLVRNSRFWDGVLAQQPQYQVSEGVDIGFFVAIAYTDRECTPEKRSEVARAAKLVSRSSNLDIKGIFVDARPKKSASKLKNPRLLDELRSEPENDDL